MDQPTKIMRAISWVLLASAVVIIAGGLIYDGLRAGEKPDLSGLYFAGMALAFVATMLGCEARRRSSGSKR